MHTTRRQLLVSVQNVREAQLARSLGVPWIDLKNPALGSLGRPDLLTARKVAAELKRTETSDVGQTSVALGELRTLQIAAARELMGMFPVSKIGLAGLGALGGPNRALRNQLDTLLAQRCDGSELVLAIYADHQRAGAPKPEAVIELARQFQMRYVLIDTFIKDGRGLFQWLDAVQLQNLNEQAAEIGASLVIAGSLQTTDWSQLDQLGSIIVGVRGGVCTSHSDRSSRLCENRLQQWLNWSEQVSLQPSVHDQT